MTTALRLVATLVLLDRSREEALRLYAFTALSITMHAGAAFLLFLLPLFTWLDEATPIAIEITAIEPPTPELEPLPELDAEPEPALPDPDPIVPEIPRPRPPAAPEEPPPAEEEPAQLDETVADFTGETLTNENGLSWASPVGNGQAVEGPLGRPGALVTGRERRGARDGAIGGHGQGDASGLVPVSDLSRRPVPPNDRLEELLEQTMPREARNLGLAGSARIQVQVEADGRVRVLRVLSEDHDGFGRACQEAVRRGGPWGPGLDREGDGAATVIPFRCTFSVR